MNLLTKRENRVMLLLLLQKPEVEFDDSEIPGAGYAPQQVHGFFYVYNFMVGVMGSLRAYRFLDPVRQPVTSAAKCLTTLVGSNLITIQEAAMPQLIPFAQRFIAGKSTRTVSARQLHEFLGSKREFATWIKNRITKWRFKEGQDFLTKLSKSPSGRPCKEYYLTLEMAKMLAMAENSEMGDQARRYFVDCEKKLLESQYAKKLPAKPSAGIPLTKPYKSMPPTTESDFYTAYSRLCHLKSWAQKNHSNVMVDDLETVERCLRACDNTIAQYAEAMDFFNHWTRQ